MRKPTNKTGRLTAELPRAALPPFVEGKVGKAGGTSMLRAKARIRRRRLSLVIAVAFLALLLGAACGVYYHAVTLGSFFGLGGSALCEQNLLILGIDFNYDASGKRLKVSNPSKNQRTDTMFLVHIAPAEHAISVLSIPRDTRVLIPGYGMGKLNSAHAQGGPRLAMDTVGSLLDVKVDHYLRFDLRRAEEILNQLGGLELYVDTPMNYVDHTAGFTIDLKPGWQKLSAHDAISFARFRHDALGDIGRVHRQQVLLNAIQQKICDPLNWWRIPRLVSVGFSGVSTDLDLQQLSEIVHFAKDRAHLNTHFATLPGDFGYDGYWLPNVSRIAAMRELLFQPAKAELAECRAEVLYAPALSDRVDSVVQRLSQAGVTVVHSRPLDAGASTNTRLIAYGEYPAWEGKLKGIFPNSPVVLSDDLPSYAANFSVVLGSDYR